MLKVTGLVNGKMAKRLLQNRHLPTDRQKFITRDYVGNDLHVKSGANPSTRPYV